MSGQDDAAASRLVAVLEDAWKAIQARHPELPDNVIVLGTGVRAGRLVKLGHWWGGQWQVEGEARGEMLLAGEALHLGPEQVFAILLHEAAHGLAAARRVPDTSRGGRYHNRRFLATAAEVGLDVERMDPYGWAETSLSERAATEYAGVIERIGEEMRLARTLPRAATSRGREPEGPDGGEGSGQTRNRRGAAECGCGRKMRMAPSVFAKGPVVCGVCETSFSLPREAARTDVGLPPSSAPVTGEEFAQRRARQLADEGRDLRLLTVEERRALERFRLVRAGFEVLTERPDAPVEIREALEVLRSVDEREVMALGAEPAEVLALHPSGSGRTPDNAPAEKGSTRRRPPLEWEPPLPPWP